ncbi:MAG: hypothetical protein ACAI37_04540, partial [Chthoniobacter sp.]
MDKKQPAPSGKGKPTPPAQLKPAGKVPAAAQSAKPAAPSRKAPSTMVPKARSRKAQPILGKTKVHAKVAPVTAAKPKPPIRPKATTPLERLASHLRSARTVALDDPTPTPTPTPVPIPTSGLVLWLRADEGVTVVDSSNHVSTWLDQSGAGNYVTATSGLQPVLVDSAINGLPAIDFSGSEIMSTNGTVLAADSFTVFLIAIPQSAITLYSESTSGTQGQSGQLYALGSANPNNSAAGACISVGTNGASIFEYASGYMPPLAVFSGGISTSCPLTVVYDSKTPTIYYCGVAEVTGLTSPRSDVYAPTQVGAADYGNFVGYIAEVLIYNTALNDSDRGTVESYLQGKYDCLPAPTP